MVEWIHVSSSAINSIGYDVTTNQMFIDFADSNPVYSFCGVPEQVFREFVNSPSIGRYYHQYIKDCYDC